MILRGGFTCQVVEIFTCQDVEKIVLFTNCLLVLFGLLQCGWSIHSHCLCYSGINFEACSELWFSVLWLFSGSANKSDAKLLVMIRQEC